MTEKPPATRHALSRAWPSLKYLSLGVWIAWLFMISSGMIWLSDTEFDGAPLALLMLSTSFIGALLCFAALLAKEKVEALLAKRTFVMGVSFAGAFGALMVIAAGPYYLDHEIFFWIGIPLLALFSSVFALKCGSLFGKLDSRRVFLYSLYSEIVMVVLSYFVVGNDFFAPIDGGPSLAGILAFALLPLIAAWLVCLPTIQTNGKQITDKQSNKESNKESGGESSRESDEEDQSRTNQRNSSDTRIPQALSSASLPQQQGFSQKQGFYQKQGFSERQLSHRLHIPSDFWKLLFMIFFFTLVSEMFRNYYVYIRLPDITYIDSKIVLLLRLGFALIMLFYALRTHREIRFSMMYQYSLVTLAVIVAIIPLIVDQSIILGSLTGGVSACMTLFIWCLLSVVVKKNNVSFIVVFGLGWGVLLFSRGCGWLLGIEVLPVIMETSWGSWIYWGVAIIILVAAVLLFSEKHMDRLFGSVANHQISLGIPQPEEDQDKEHRPWHEASVRIGTRAMLSQREMEILELIARGRSPKNVAQHLVISVNTVRTHIRNIYAKVGAHSREELVELIEQESKSIEE